jgi:hypothetical protein
MDNTARSLLRQLQGLSEAELDLPVAVTGCDCTRFFSGMIERVQLGDIPQYCGEKEFNRITVIHFTTNGSLND